MIPGRGRSDPREGEEWSPGKGRSDPREEERSQGGGGGGGMIPGRGRSDLTPSYFHIHTWYLILAECHNSI